MLQGPCALAYGGESVVNVARALVEKVKGMENVEFKGAIMEGQVFQANEVDKLSKFPTKDEAQAQVIQVILGAAGSLIGTITGAGGALGGVLKTIEEKLEGQADDATVKSLAS
jgi:large subunit ribosomal protein L10